MKNNLELNVKWRKHIIAYSSIVVFIFFFYYQTLSSLVNLWMTSDAYGHGSIVIIISFFLIWLKRKELYPVSPQTEIWAIPLILIAVLLWFLAKQVDVNIVQQYVFISLIQLSFLLVFGRKIAGLVLFPLIYMFLAVPVGQSLLGPMVIWTAEFVIHSIELLGIPIYYEGTRFSLPTSDWSVIDACSGSRYFFASITLGTLYAYLTYSNYYKRTIFIVMSAVAPIVANWIRALGIVLIAHYNDMALAKGIEHFIAGWVFFGIVMFTLFWIGSFWADSKDKKEQPVTADVESQVNSNKVLGLTFLVIIIFSLGPGLNYFFNNREMPSQAYSAKIKVSEMNSWKLAAVNSINWKPTYINPSLEYQQEFKKNDQVVGLYIAYYFSQQQETELINASNIMFSEKKEKDRKWHQLKETTFMVNMDGDAEKIIKTHLSSKQQDILLFRWNNISGKVVINNYLGKMLELFDKLTGNTKGEFAVVLYTPIRKNIQGEKLLQEFINDMYSSFSSPVE